MGETKYTNFASTLLSKSLWCKPHLVVVEGLDEPYKLNLLRTVLIKSVWSFLRVPFIDEAFVGTINWFCFTLSWSKVCEAFEIMVALHWWSYYWHHKLVLLHTVLIKSVWSFWELWLPSIDEALVGTINWFCFTLSWSRVCESFENYSWTPLMKLLLVP